MTEAAGAELMVCCLVVRAHKIARKCVARAGTSGGLNIKEPRD